MNRQLLVAILRNPQPLDWLALRHRADHLGLSELLKQLYERSRQVPTGDDIDL